MKLRFLGGLLGTLILILQIGCGGDNQQEIDRRRTRTAEAEVTATALPTGTAAATDTPAPTSTTRPTDTPAAMSPTATPTATPTPRPGETATPLGPRTFSIVPIAGALGATTDETRTGLFSTGLTGNNVGTAFEAQDLALFAGTTAADGIAPLTLVADAVLAVTNPQSTVCFRLLAAGSTGRIDCNGGTAFDAELVQEAGEDAPPAELTTGIGVPAGSGAAELILMQESVQIAVGSTLDDCLADDLQYDAPVPVVYTTESVTATKGDQTITVSGEPFSCAQFGEEDTAGMLASPSVAFNPPVPGDVANVLRLADRD